MDFQRFGDLVPGSSIKAYINLKVTVSIHKDRYAQADGILNPTPYSSDSHLYSLQVGCGRSGGSRLSTSGCARALNIFKKHLKPHICRVWKPKVGVFVRYLSSPNPGPVRITKC